MQCDLLIHGNIITMEPDQPRANWLAVDNGKIISVSDREPIGLEPKQVLELGDQAVMPGFIDCHAHGSDTGLYLNSVKLADCKTLADVLNAVDEYAKNTSDNIVISLDLNDNELVERRMPYMWELDEVSHGKDVMLNQVSLHASTCNTSFWNQLKFNYADTAVDKLPDGRCTGILRDGIPYNRAYCRMFENVTEETWISNRFKTAQFAFERGITTIHTLDGSTGLEDMLDVTSLLDHLDEMPINFVPFVEDFDVSLAKKHNLKQAGGCLLLDGAASLHTAAQYEPYADRPETIGQLNHNDEKVYQFLHDAHVNGMQATMHAIGTRAIDQIMYGIRRVLMEEGSDNKYHRHRIEHFSCAEPRQIEMCAELGIIASMQPAFGLLWGKEFTDKLYGEERAARYSIANCIKGGMVVCGGSDSPVTDLNPLPGINFLVNCPMEYKKVPIYEAFKLYTTNAAFAGHEEDVRGSIKEGKIADLVVLSFDPFEHSDKIDKAEIMKTISGGKIVYEK